MIDRVLAKVIKTDTCWFWGGGHGGPQKRPYFRNQLVYRILYVHFRGPIPDGKVLDHVVCDNPRCINPWHVEPRTQRENLERAGCLANLGDWAVAGSVLDRPTEKFRELANGRGRDSLGRFVGG